MALPYLNHVNILSFLAQNQGFEKFFILYNNEPTYVKAMEEIIYAIYDMLSRDVKELKQK